MNSTIYMEDLRNLNLFQKITQIRTRFCFTYNNQIFFCVPKKLVTRAIGREGINVKRINQILKKRIRIVAGPEGLTDAEEFLRAVVSPIEFKSIEITPMELILNAGSHNKAALIGREKRRLIELQKIVKDFFGKELKLM